MWSHGIVILLGERAALRTAGGAASALDPPVALAQRLRDAVSRHYSYVGNYCKTTFLLYFATPAGMMALCDATGAVSIIGRWKPFV